MPFELNELISKIALIAQYITVESKNLVKRKKKEIAKS